ncbi:MAG: Flp family type IVb pilin [Verrucomicrobiae bacterium]|nr:Flp family type IVb pilin [Verrucomicrobiae bacterium]
MVADMKALVLRRSKGQTLVEYALIIALVSVLLIAALTALKGGISNSFNGATAQLNPS